MLQEQRDGGSLFLINDIEYTMHKKNHIKFQLNLTVSDLMFYVSFYILTAAYFRLFSTDSEL